MSTPSDEPNGSDAWQDPDEGFPIYRAQPTPQDVPGFMTRALAHLRTVEGTDDVEFEHVTFQSAQDVWLAPIGAYVPEEDAPSTPEEVAAGASPTGRWGVPMLEWETGVRRAMREAWGEPVTYTPRLVADAQEPEGILDYVMLAQDFAEAQLWDRGDVFVALFSDWSGEPAASMLRQVALVLPREHIMRGMGAFLDGDAELHELLMHGEHPIELRRRAWLMSTIYDRGEVRLRDAPIDAVRCNLQALDGTTTVWIFADDERQLVLIQDPTCTLVEVLDSLAGTDSLPTDEETGVQQPWSHEQLILIDRMLDGVPDDLRACITARGETMHGDVAEHALEFGLLDGRPVPIISGAFWFDGTTWRATPGLAETAYRHGLAADDLGFREAVRKPYRLGGAFTVAQLAAPNDVERREILERVFEACPFPEQPRPEGDACLAYGIPRENASPTEIVEAIELASAAWWDRDPEDCKVGDRVFVVAGRELDGRAAVGTIDTILATSGCWTVDALREWTYGLLQAMDTRWGEHQMLDVLYDNAGVAGRRTPLTRLIRASGFSEAPLWWVNGHAVALLAGVPDPAHGSEPIVLIGIVRADSVMEMLGRMKIWEARRRARYVESLATLVSGNGNKNDDELQPAGCVPWDGPPLEGSQVVPPARRIVHRTNSVHWVWHLTHDGRGLLTSHTLVTDTLGSSAQNDPASFAEQVKLFTGVPDDLLSLVVDRDPDGAYPAIEREGDPDGTDRLARARTLPAATAVFFYDGLDWRTTTAMLRRAHAKSQAEGIDPVTALYSTEVGVPQLVRLLLSGEELTTEQLTDPRYGQLAVGRAITPEEANAAYDRLGTPIDLALTGTLNDLIDVVLDGPEYRYLLDAALSAVDPTNRREIALWLLEQGVDASSQLSFLTPVNVLLANLTLDADDAAVLSRLLDSGADPGCGRLGVGAGLHPIVQLCDRDLDESDLLPLVEVLLGERLLPATTDEDTPPARVDLTAPALPDGLSVLDYVRAGTFPHDRSRTGLLTRLQEET
ncbi:hypothetical protein [Salana multivorans]